MRFALVISLLASLLFSAGPSLAQTPAPPQQKWLPFVAQQWSAAQALCQEDINPLALQIGALQSQAKVDADKFAKQLADMKTSADEDKRVAAELLSKFQSDAQAQLAEARRQIEELRKSTQ